MSNGTYDDFLDALRAFESGWDSDRYATGQISDAQLNQWSGGTVSDFYPGLSSWGDMTQDQWDEMSYRSENSLGFVGYQFGEALLIDLGYYQAEIYYPSTATNLWEGTWTGKNGVNSLDDFKTEAVQEVAIREAFGQNLQIIEQGLAYQGKSLDDFLGTTVTYPSNGEVVSVTYSLTGILSAAHLRGAFGTLNLLLSDTVSFDENGTSILQYVDQFGGFDSPDAPEIIALYTEANIGGSGDGGGAAGVTAETADVVVDWVYGSAVSVTDFDPEIGTIFVGWVGPMDLNVMEVNGNTVFEIASNLQTITLVGVELADLSSSNFTFLDTVTATEVLALIGTDTDEPIGDGGPVDDDTDDDTGGDTGQGNDDAGGDATGGEGLGNGSAGVTKDTADVVVTWSYGTNTVLSDFDVTSDTIFVDWIPAAQLEILDAANGVVISVPSNDQTLTLTGVSLSDLTAANFTILDDSSAVEILGVIGGGAGNGEDNGHSHDDDDDGHGHMHVAIGLDTQAQIIDDFMPAVGDVIEIEADVFAQNFTIFEESGDALGRTVRIAITDGINSQQIILTGFGLEDLSLGNFSAVNEGVLNELASALGASAVTPADGAFFELSYDSDGSHPAGFTGVTDEGGTKFRADFNTDDIVGFDPAADELDFSNFSVHSMIVTKSETGEIVIDTPWSENAQIVQGVTYQDVTIDNFGVVQNEHLRQDLGGVVSWEQGIGPREADTIYVRSHEYGVHEVVDGFDPATMNLSFLYFGTRERLSVEDTPDGLFISSLPSSQSLTLTGVTRADLIPGRVEFHHDQVIEDNLEDPFGFAQDDVTLVSRAQLLTPQAPEGSTTDGGQVRQGDMTAGGANVGVGPDATGSDDDTLDQVEITWDWGVQDVVSGFDLATDSFDFGALTADLIDVTEQGGDLLFEVLNNGGHTYTVLDVQAEDLSAENLTSDATSALLDESSAFVAQLTDLGFEFA